LVCRKIRVQVSCLLKTKVILIGLGCANQWIGLKR
jgi:hypothetical protein